MTEAALQGSYQRVFLEAAVGGLKRRWLLAFGIALAVLVWVASTRGTARLELRAEQGLVLRVAPGTHGDPGPAYIVGAESDPEGSRFTSADFFIDGPGAWRVYFDRRDNANCHFLERSGDTVSLGLTEAGVEQVLATGKLPPPTPSREGRGNTELRLARHGSYIGLFQQGKVITAAFDDRLCGGSAGFRMASGGPAITLKVEPREDIHFSDDFMISDAKGAQWRGNGTPQGGDFAVKSLRHPLLSANAFNYMGAGSNVYSVAGQPWWDRYSYEASVRGPAGGRIGLVFAFQDEKNYGLFRWSARKLAADGTTVVEAGKRELVRVRGGTEEVLASAPGGYAPDQWYAAQLLLTYARVQVCVDGHSLLEASDPYLAAGGAGVWCDVPLPAALAPEPKAQAFAENSLDALMRQHAVFDDVRINTLEGFDDDFRVPGPLAGGWMVGPGDWVVSADQSGNGCGVGSAGVPAGILQVLPQAGSTKALIGDRRWAQYEVEADVQPGNGGAGLVFLHRDENNYYSATVEKGLFKLNCVADGQATVVDSAPLEEAGLSMRLRVSIKHGHVRATANPPPAPSREGRGNTGAALSGEGRGNTGAAVETFVGGALLRGRAGLVAFAGRRGAPCVFKHFRLGFLPEREPLVTTNAVFEDEASMSQWTSPTGEWHTPKGPAQFDGRPVNMLWHCCQFPGDVEVGVEPREFADKEPNFDLALSVSKDGQGRNNGYVLRYKCGQLGDSSSRSSVLQLLRQGELKCEKALAEDPRQLASVALRRCGKYVVGLVDGRAAIQCRDDQPLTGNKVAYYTRGVALRSEATKIASDNFRNDLFSAAPTAWRTAGVVVAEVTNRWQCDPRWSFFSLKNDLSRVKEGLAAALWSKYFYPGDVTLEFFVGNKMEVARGKPYVYVRDINVTIASDGSNLAKGYTFMWGAHGNTGSVILRDGVEVKRSGERIETDTTFHNGWYVYRVEKQGGRLTFRVVDTVYGKVHCELSYDDPHPLEGSRVAIWTYNHCIMLSRVRISGDGGNVAEHPDWRPEPLRTPYDGK
ncbi:MAG: hypothetical protein ABSE73_00920 [Planctomycetota bacterium]